MKFGDKVDRIMLLQSGQIDVKVPILTEDSESYTFDGLLDTLNIGSCFCVYSAFTAEKEQMVSFVAKTSVVIDCIRVKDILKLQKLLRRVESKQ